MVLAVMCVLKSAIKNKTPFLLDGIVSAGQGGPKRETVFQRFASTRGCFVEHFSLEPRGGIGLNTPPDSESPVTHRDLRQ